MEEWWSREEGKRGRGEKEEGTVMVMIYE
jgi:hypothetical protein